MDPSTRLDYYLKKGRCAVFFSATLLPVRYYREQLAGRPEDYAIYAPSPFPAAHRCILIARDVSSKYSQRSPAGYQRMSDYILSFCREKTGNYLVFFPSYRMMEEVSFYLHSAVTNEEEITFYTQNNSMTEDERETFLSHFQPTPSKTTVGLCTLGGIFGEGIDLVGDRLIGAVIVGTGLPMVCRQNELFREYFDKKNGEGFPYAYQYPAMNNVLQAAGRVIRTMEDRGAILLLDQRFLQQSYQELFPREWFPHHVVNLRTMTEYLRRFWDTSVS
jgi:Rad3-related DNA helicase